MSSSNVTNLQNEINTINLISTSIQRYFVPFLFVFGVASNALNIFVFTRPVLRRTPCCIYFLCSSTAALIYTVINLPLRTLQLGYNIDPTIYILSLCKIKYFFTYSWRALIPWFIVLACLDRFLHSSSNAKLRRLSSLKVALYTIPLTFLLVNIAYVHVLIYYKLNSTPSCTSATPAYGLFLGIWHLIVYGIGPPILMFIFSSLTIQHIRHRRVMPVATHATQSNGDSTKDKNLFQMVFFQCLFVTLTTSIYSASQLYSSATSFQTKDRLQIAKDNLITVVLGSLSATGHNTTFFIFTLTSKMFRQQLRWRRHERLP